MAFFLFSFFVTRLLLVCHLNKKFRLSLQCLISKQKSQMRNTKRTNKTNQVTKEKEPIRLRLKKLANGNQSIYLEKYDSYKITSSGTISTKKSYEFLKLYLIPETTPASKIANEATMRMASTIKSKRIVDLQTQNSGLQIKKQIKVNLIDYVSEIANKAFADTNKKRSEYYTFKSLVHHLKIYRGDRTLINNIDKVYINGFIDYLKTAKNGNFEGKINQPIISENTAHKLFAKFSTVLKKAVQDDILNTNPLQKINDKDKPKTKPSKREYLTLDEIKILIETDCSKPDIKGAFLFCCLVGIRFENVKNLKWGDIVTNSTGTVLSYKQIKVETYETLPISDEAIKFLPIRTDKKLSDKIFHLPKNETTNEALEKWATSAKISKKITFHVSRHTAATLQLSLGTPIETVSKLLGHSKISTTQIYAKIIDKNKEAAVNLQNGLFK